MPIVASNIGTCGTLENPCQTIKDGISKVDKSCFGTIIMEGEFTINEPIEIKQDVFFTSMGGAVLLGGSSMVVFRITKEVCPYVLLYVPK